MPLPKRMGDRRRFAWDVRALDAEISALPDAEVSGRVEPTDYNSTWNARL
jgi:hypothetical protein